MKHYFTYLFLGLSSLSLKAQDSLTTQTLAPFSSFSTTRVLNNHSVETLEKRNFDFRITHRFGDMGGESGGYHSLWGLDNSTDIRIAFEYGITDNLMAGVGRSKGGGVISELYDGFVKYRIINPSEKLPLSITALGSSAITSMRASSLSTSESAFTKELHRLRYTTQLLVGYKLSSRISTQLVPSFHHRNFVKAGDKNDLFALGIGTRVKISQLIALNVEYTYNRFAKRDNSNYQDEMGIGIEFDLGGHVFQLDLTNSKGIGENQFISGTTSDISKGQYRMGFTISRPFKL